VLLEREEVVGYAGLCDYPDEAWVQTMAVAPTHQRQGLGDRLLRDLLAEAERRRQRVVSLEVAADNLSAQRLYERHGFTRTGVRRGYYQPSGTDAYVLSRRT
jgi:ribosomal-protein-alanine N-acetyltransferase